MIVQKRILVILTVRVMLFASCQSKKEKLSTQIAEAEKQIYESFNTETMQQLVTLYQDYAKSFPKDSLSAEYLYCAAEFNMRLKKGEAALTNLDILTFKYPDSGRIPDAYFLKGFVYENVLYDIQNAINAYYEFVSKFPSHKLALDASITISYLEKGMSPEDVVASFDNSNIAE